MINRKIFCKSGPGLKCDQETDRHAERPRRDCSSRPHAVLCCVDGEERCQSWEWRCDSGECIDARLKCDGNRDCRDATDEFDCEGN